MLTPLQKEHCRYRLPVDVTASDVNLFGSFSPCAILRYMDRGRVEAIEAHARETGEESWLTAYIVNVYKIDIKRGDGNDTLRPIEVRTGVRKTSSHRATFDQLIVSEDEKVLFEAAIEVLFLDLNRQLAVTPEKIPGLPHYKPASALAPKAPPVPFSKRDHFGHLHPLRVYYEDTDAQGIVYHVSYLRFFERALFPLIVDTLPGLRPQLLSHTIRYMNSCHLGDELEIKMGGRMLDDRRALLDVRIYSKATGKLATDAMVELDFLDQNDVLRPIPSSIKEICQNRP